jgi:hypothetical protein
MVQEIEMTKEEQMTMYMKCSKKELCKMLIEANRHLKNLPIPAVVVTKGTLCEHPFDKVTYFMDNSAKCECGANLGI